MIVNPDSAPLPTLEIRLLGVPQISKRGVVSSALTSAKAQALLYYLAMTGRAHTRVALASLLWGERADEEARSNLRKALQQLREHLDAYLVIERDTIQFRAAQAYWVDAVEFATQLTTARAAANPDQLQQALALYRGDFLEGFYVREAPEFETWMLAERARLRELMLQELDTLAMRYANQGDFPQAIAAARRLLELEPWREETHRQLMEWLAQNGQRSAALAHYVMCFV
jgi:DNA-binding SARP family transcriptional activator